MPRRASGDSAPACLHLTCLFCTTLYIPAARFAILNATSCTLFSLYRACINHATLKFSLLPSAYCRSSIHSAIKQHITFLFFCALFLPLSCLTISISSCLLLGGWEAGLEGTPRNASPARLGERGGGTCEQTRAGRNRRQTRTLRTFPHHLHSPYRHTAIPLTGLAGARTYRTRRSGYAGCSSACILLRRMLRR